MLLPSKAFLEVQCLTLHVCAVCSFACSVVVSLNLLSFNIIWDLETRKKLHRLILLISEDVKWQSFCFQPEKYVRCMPMRVHTHTADVLSGGEICVLNSTSFFSLSVCLCLGGGGGVVIVFTVN
jgi:hypothetical protein